MRASIGNDTGKTRGITTPANLCQKNQSMSWQERITGKLGVAKEVEM